MNEPKKTFILNTLVGSHAHGLAAEDADKDYRGVYVIPTKDLLSIGFDGKKVLWEEGERDQTGYEVGHFLQLALRGVPNILEVFVAPRVPPTNLEFDTLGFELRELFPCVIDRPAVYYSFLNYAENQRKKMLDNHENRWKKYAVAYIRTLQNLSDFMIDYRRFDIKVLPTFRVPTLLSIKNGEWTLGEVIDHGEELKLESKAFFEGYRAPILNLEKVNAFLLKVRKEFWHG